MDFEAIVHLVLPVVKGQGARGEWTKQEVVFELPAEQYNRKICVGFWNDKAPAAAALRAGDRVLVSVNIESRERNGRWFTEARGWKFTVLNSNGAAPAQGGYAAPAQGGYAAPAQGGYAAPAQGGYGAAAGGYEAPAAGGYGAAAPEMPAAAAPLADDLPF